MSTPPHNDLDRIRQEYQDRNIRLQNSDRYSPLNIAYLFMLQQRLRANVDLFRRLGLTTLRDLRLLEVGCGHGDVLQELTFYRIPAAQLCGIELRPESLPVAQRRFPGVVLAAADAQQIPFSTASFDVVLQYTMFSSILDDAIKANIAREMVRVVKPGGVIIWYDFWLNPTNAQTKGVSKSEITRLFPGCALHFQRVTLAPPVARKIVPLSWAAGVILEKLRFLNTHYLVTIRPQ